jgi:acetylornithine deacetylase
MAAMLVAFARLVQERPRDSASVVMACTVDEEFTHTGSSRLAAGAFEWALAIVAEPTRLQVVNCHKGAVRWKVRTRGVACHSSTPHLGDNAIYHMAKVVSTLAEYAQRLAQAPADPILGPPSLSVGRIEGGQSVNVVPDRCEIEVDRRIIPGEDAPQCLTEAQAFVRDHLGSLDRVDFLPPWVNMPPLSSQGSAPWITALQTAVARVTGRSPDVVGVPYGTDAGPLSAAGIPCLVFGPGDIAQAHTQDEWVDLNEVRAASDIYFEVARTLGST